MRPLPASIALLAVLVAAAGLVYWLMEGGSTAPDLEAGKPPALKKRSGPDSVEVGVAKGGVFGGIVLDADARPVDGAHVLLVAFNAGDDDLLSGRGRGDRPFDPGDPGSIPVIGDYKIGGKETVTKEDGRFVIPAHSRARVTHVLAYHREYFLNVVAVPGPMEGIVIPLQKAGRVKGRIIDHESGRPVGRAQVDIFLQHPTALAPEVGTGREGSLNRGRGGVSVPRSEIAMLGHFLAKELGERLWSIPYQRTEALRFTADKNGEFEIGPLGVGVQLEFVITHPDYKWFDFDTQGGKQRARRTIVGPGETVEREFRLRRGLEITGRVVDFEGKPIKGVVINAESITAYARHWFYAIGKKRFARTGKDGRFTLGGLALGKNNLRLTHDSFGEQWRHGVAGGTKDLEIAIKQRGRIIGTIEGLLQRPLGGRVYVTLEPAGDDPGHQTRLSRRKFILDKDHRFSIEKVKEGPYEIWLHADESCSMPQPIDVVAGAPVKVAFELGGGGHLRVMVLDGDERVVDPALAFLVRVTGDTETTMGRYVAREGVVETDSVLPGRYRLRIEAAGFVPALTDPFDVLEGRPTDMGIVTLHAWAYLRIESILTDRRSSPKTDTTLEYRVGDGEWRPLRSLGGFDVPIRPGRLEVRGRTEAGLAFDQTYQTVGGEVTPVAIVLR